VDAPAGFASGGSSQAHRPAAIDAPQEFTCRRLGLADVPASADLVFDGRLTADRTWFAARPRRRG
jgi:hypothetical protein